MRPRKWHSPLFCPLIPRTYPGPLLLVQFYSFRRALFASQYERRRGFGDRASLLAKEWIIDRAPAALHKKKKGESTMRTAIDILRASKGGTASNPRSPTQNFNSPYFNFLSSLLSSFSSWVALLPPLSLPLLPSHGEQIEKERRGEGKLNFCLLLLRSFAAAAENFYELSSLSPSSTLVNKKFLPHPFFQTGDGDPPFPRKVITALCRVATPQKKERRRGGGGGYSPLLCPSGPIFPSPSRRRRISFHFPPNCEAKKYIPSVDGERRGGGRKLARKEPEEKQLF